MMQSNNHPVRSRPRHFIDLRDLETITLRRIVDMSHAMKRAGRRTPPEYTPVGISDLALIMIFEKPSTRTRVSADLAMRQLGGRVISLNDKDTQLGRGEPHSDTIKVLSRYADAVMLRVNSHDTLTEFAKYSEIPIINGLSNVSHPGQIIADIMTFEERCGKIEGSTVAWIGDGNNVAVSWMHAAVRLGFTLRLACPPEFFPSQAVIDWAKAEGGRVEIGHDAVSAVRGTDCVITDTWVSMGDTDAARRKQILAPYRVDETLMSHAKQSAIFLHCLPAYRGNEVAASVIDGPQSAVLDEAENRLHAHKAILAWCLGV